MRASSVAENISVWRVAGVAATMVVDVIDKAHVQHAVGFVEHQHVAVRTGRSGRDCM